MQKPTLDFIGYASGIAARDIRCCMGPLILQDSKQLKQLKHPWRWIDNIYPKANINGMQALLPVAELCTRLAYHISQLTKNKRLFATIGGDHSCAIGTWSGVAAGVSGPIGLLWIDAHMDSHTPATSPSMNIHGMPLASLLGYGPKELKHVLNDKAKLLPQHVCLLGVRSFEEGEADLLKKLGVRVYFMQEIDDRGLSVVMAEALEIINKGTVGYGISIDLDGIDPIDAPGVDTQVKHGIRAQDFITCLTQLQHYPNVLGLEFAEFNPSLDINNTTAKLIIDLIDNILNGLDSHTICP